MYVEGLGRAAPEQASTYGVACRDMAQLPITSPSALKISPCMMHSSINGETPADSHVFKLSVLLSGRQSDEGLQITDPEERTADVTKSKPAEALREMMPMAAATPT